MANAGRTSKTDGDLYKFGVVAERPTGAGLTLGMGLRANTAEQDW